MANTNETSGVEKRDIFDEVREALKTGALDSMPRLHTAVEDHLKGIVEELRVLNYDSRTHPDDEARETALVGYQRNMDVWADATVAKLALETTYGRATGQQIGGCVLGATPAYRETILGYL